jgi:alkylation response protein AidB-like acyl-CoA dehydrogenase
VRFAFTDDQLTFRDTVRDFLKRECPPSLVRSTATVDEQEWSDVWRDLAEMGVVGLTAPESRGGLGMSVLDLVLVLEETGRFAMPGPIVETSAVALPLLGDHDWSGRAAGGGEILSVGLDGSPYVGFGADAGALLLARDGEVHLVETGGFRAEPVRSVDGLRRLARVAWEPAASIRVGGAKELAEACDRAAVAVAAQLCGVAAQLLDMTVDYAKERRQFGVPIGTFQAVKHHCANAMLKLEYARPVVYRAAYSITHDDPNRSLHASMAKAYASDAADVAARVALQVHGAIGYTAEHDLQLWMKRAWALGRAWGDAVSHRERVARVVLDPA